MRRLRSSCKYRCLTLLLRLQDPKANARRACAEKDFRFRVVYGYKWVCPASTRIPDALINKHGCQMVPGAFGVSYSATEFAYRALAGEYAKQHNDEVLRHLPSSDFEDNPA